MHIQDWLPTIYSAIGGRHQDLGDIDGIDMWNTLNYNLKTPRKQLLHNIDDIWNVWALRDGDYKLIYGSTLNGTYNTWFLPPGESIRTNIKNFEQNYHKKSVVYKILKQMNLIYKKVEPIVINCNFSAKTECKPEENACLFDIKSDPCEYNNLFKQKPEIVKSLLKQLLVYNSTAVKPIVRAIDPEANPVFHNYRCDVWQ